MQQARDLPFLNGEPVAAARLLLQLGDDEPADIILIEGEAGVRVRKYARWRARADARTYPHRAGGRLCLASHPT